MTVGELIQQLSRLDKDALVVVDYDPNDDWVETKFTLVEGGFGRETDSFGWFFEGKVEEEYHERAVFLKSTFA